MSTTKDGNRDFFVVPVFHKTLKDLVTSQGECLVMECRVKGVPPPVITWKREGYEIEDCADFRMLHRGEVATLVIGEAFPEDSGTFTCEATNKAGTAETSCRLIVKGGGYHTVSTKSAATAQQYQSNNIQVLPLPTREKPNEEHAFKEEKQQVVDDIAKVITSPTPKSPRQDIKTEGDYIVSSPTMAAVHGKEPQEYKISAFDQRLMSEIEYRLERTPPINEHPEDGVYEDVPAQQQRRPAFTVSLKSIKMALGAAAKFNCKTTGSPKPKIFWFKDGKQISKKSQHYIQKSDNNGNHELAVDHLTLEDDGNYTALAVNPQSRVSTTGRLLILGKGQSSNNGNTNAERTYRSSSPVSPLQPIRVTSPHITSSQLTSPRMLSPQSKPQTPTSPTVEYIVPPEKGELADDEQSPVEKYYRPTFIQKPPQDTHAEEGKLVRFNVKVTGLPAPEIEWLINGRPVRQDVLHKILVRENNVHSLLLERVSPMDEGQYSIVATNVAGTATIHPQLHVTAREFMTAPAFVQRLSPQCVAQGDAVRLEARVVGTPKPIIAWKRGSDQVISDHKTQLYQDDTGYVCLQITQTDMRDAAWYTCSATNKAGISSCNCKLDVYSPTSDVTTTRRRIRTPHRYASLAKVAGVDMREALTPEAQLHQHLPESEEL